MVEVPDQTPKRPKTAEVWTRGDPAEVLDVNRPILARFTRLIKEKRHDELLEITDDWSPIDLMELLVQLPLKRARQLYDWLPVQVAAKVLIEVSSDLRAALVAESTPDRIAEIARDLNDDDVVELLSDLPTDEAEAVLALLPHDEALRERLSFDDDSDGAIMSDKFVAVLDDWEVSAATIEKLYEVYVVDDDRRLVGRLKLRDLLLQPKRTLVRDIMRQAPTSVHPDADQEEVLELAEQYNLQTIPVLDADRRVIGRITVDELRDVVRSEADEDIKLMSGVAPDSQPDESVVRLVKGRLPWLVSGLVGGSLAALVVGSFEEQLEQAAILASFIPVVMAMAGNAGIQASTVTVQGLASGNLWIGDLGRRVVKELAGALINGLVVATLLVCFIMVTAEIVEIEGSFRLAMAAGLSLLLVVMMAATFGSTVPLLLNYFKIDPAVSTGVFITTSNDVFGVLVYFVMASAIYLDGFGGA